MSLTTATKSLLTDFYRLGVPFLGHNLSRMAGKDIAQVQVRDVGAVWVRPKNSDVDTLRQVFGLREYALDFPKAMTERVRARYEAIIAGGGTPIIVDAGANIGAASLWFGKEFPKAAIVAIEPDPGNAAVLRMNVDARANVKVMEAAIGAEAGFVSLSDGEANGGGWGIQTERASEGVPVVTVDDAFAAASGDTPFMVKIDIEGFESDLFEQNIDWISKAFVIFIEPHDWMMPGKMTSRSFQKAMAEHPFEVFLRGENLIYVRVA